MAKAIKSAVKVFAVTFLVATGLAFALGTVGITGAFLFGVSTTSIAAMSALSTLVGGLMSKGTNATSENFGNKVATRTATAPRQIIYGKARVGGTITHVETSGTDNYKLSMIVVLAGHQVESLEKVLINDEELTTTTSGGFEYATNSKFTNSDNDNKFPVSNSLLRYKFKDGSQTTADSDITGATSLGSTDKFIDVAYMLIEFVFDSEAFGGGIPPMSFVVKGKKVYDPRSGQTAFTDSTGKEIGSNPALCVRDYLTDTTYGLKATSSEINDTTALGGFASAANTCETAAGAITTATVNGAISSSTTVTVDTSSTLTLIDIGQTVTGTGITGTVTVIKRTGLVVTLSSAVTIADGVTLTFNEGSYIANGITNMTADGAGVIEGLLSSCAGKMSYINGKFVMFAGASVTPEMTITDDNLLAPISITTKQASGETFNTVKAVYVDGNNNYVATDSPTETTVNPATSNTFLSEDTPTGESEANYRKNLEIQLPFTDSTTLAQRLQRTAILHSRQEVALSVLCNIAYMQLQPFDWVYLTNERLGYTNKVFEVLSTNLEVMEQDDVPMLATRLDLKEIDSSVYGFASSSYTSPIDEGSSVPTGSFSVTAPTNLSLTVDLQLDSTTSKVNIDASWTNNPDDLIQGTEILYGTSSGTYIGSVLVGKGKTKAVIPNLMSNSNYYVVARHFSSNNVFSPNTGEQTVNTGLPSAPSAPDIFSATTGKALVIGLQWTAPSNSDLRAVKVYRHTSNFTPTDDTYLVSTITSEPSQIQKLTFGLEDGLTAGTTYHFAVRAINHSGTHSTFTSTTTGSFTLVDAGDIDLPDFSGYFHKEGNTTTALTSAQFNTEYGRTPLTDDILIMVNTSATPKVSKAYKWNGSAFVEINNFTTGDLVVDGTLAGDKIIAQTISADRVDTSFISTLNLLTTSATITNNITVGTGNAVFKAETGVGIQLGHATFSSAPFSVTEGGLLKAESGTIGGINLASNKLYVGTGTVNNSNTAFYVDDSGNFSLKDKVYWNGTSLSVDGNITATTLDVVEANIQNLTLTLGGGILQDGSGNNLTVTSVINPDFPVNGLLHYFPLNGFSDPNDTTPADVIDVVSNVTGVITGSNGSFATDSPNGQSYVNGATTGITLLSNAQANTWQTTTGDYTVALWFKSTTESGQTLARIIGRDASNFWSLVIDQDETGNQTIGLYTDGDLLTWDGASVNEWHHIALVVNGTTSAKVYVDGVLRITDTDINYLTDPRPVVLGCNTEAVINNTSSVFLGKLSDVRFYTKNITDKQVQSLYMNPAGGLPAKIEGDLFVTNSITADKLIVNSLSSLSANLGSVTAGQINIGSGAFTVNTAGVLDATGASINGTFVAGSGTNIFTADTNGIYLGNGTFANAPFKVLGDGEVQTTKTFTAGVAGSGQIAKMSGTGDYRFWSGSESPSNASFAVDKDGKAIARNLVLKLTDGTVYFDSETGFSDSALSQIGRGSNTKVTTISTTTDSDSEFEAITVTANTDVNVTVSIDSNFGGFADEASSNTAIDNAEKEIPANFTLTIQHSSDGGSSYATVVTDEFRRVNDRLNPDTSPDADEYKINSNVQVLFISGQGGTLFLGSTTTSLGTPTTNVGCVDSDGRTTLSFTGLTLTGTASGTTHRIKATVSSTDTANGQTTGTPNYDATNNNVTATAPRVISVTDPTGDGFYVDNGTGSTVPPSGDITGVQITTSSSGGLTGGANFTSGDASFTLALASSIDGARTFTNNVVIQGNLDVQGTTTSIDTTNLEVKDNNITLNYSTGDSSATANGAGITIQDAVSAGNDATLTWATTSDRFNLSHGLDLPDSALLVFGSDDDFRITHNNTNAVLSNYTGDIDIKNFADDKDIRFWSDDGSGGTAIYFRLDGSASTGGVYYTYWGDNSKIALGDSKDLRLFHNGTNSIIQNATDADLIIQNDFLDKDIYIKSDNGSGGLATYILADGSTGEVRLYHYGSEKFNTTSSGVEITGSISSGAVNSTGNVTSTATMNINASGTADTHLNIGTNTSSNHYAYLDLIGDSTYTDYGLRLIRNNGGANTSSAIYHRGTGELLIETDEVASIKLRTDSSDALTIDGTQNSTFEGNLSVKGPTLDVGENDAVSGLIIAYGAATGSEGGEIRLHTTAAHDTTYDFYRIDVLNDTLRIGRAGQTDLTINATGTIVIGGSINSGAITSSSTLTANQTVTGFRHVAPDVMSGHTNRNEIKFNFTSDETRWYIVPIVDGSSNFGREFTFNYSTQEWTLEGSPIVLASGLHGTPNIAVGTVTATGLTVDTSTLVVDSTNNRVGIGTVSPERLLHILGTDSTQLKLEQTSASSDVRMLLDAGGTNAQLQFAGASHASIPNTLTLVSAADTRFVQAGQTVMHIDSANGGRVGIGSQSPDAKLRIDQDNTAVALKVTGGDSGVNIAEFSRDIGATASVNIHASSGEPQITFGDANTFSIGVNSTDFEIADAGTIGTNTRFSIDSTGNITIGGSINTGAINSSSLIKTTSNIQSGENSGGVALTINDGYGNANVTFNHLSGVPEQDGNSARIEVNTDSVGSATMAFELKSSVSSGVAVAMDSIMQLNDNGLYMDAGKFIHGSGGVTINANDTDFVVEDETDAVTNFIWRDFSSSKLFLGTDTAVVTLRSNLDALAKIISAGSLGELQIFNDGSNSVIRSSDDLLIQRNTSPRSAIKVTDSTGKVELYYAGSAVLETTSTGISVTDTINFTDPTAFIRNSQDASGQIIISVLNPSSSAQAVRWDAANNANGAWRPDVTAISDLGLTNRVWDDLYINQIKIGASNNTFVDISRNVTANSIQVLGGTAGVGVADTTAGAIDVYGGSSGDEGGEIRLHTSAAHDTTYQWYRIDAFQDDLRIGRSGQTDLYIFQDGLVRVENNFQVGGTISSGAITTSNTLNVNKDGTAQNLAVFSSDLGTNTRNFTILTPASDSTTAPFEFSTGNSFQFTIDSSPALSISASGKVQVGDLVSQNLYGILQVNQVANDDEGGIGILDATTQRSMRIWVDDTTSYINSGNGGSSNLILNQGTGKVGVQNSSPSASIHAGNSTNRGTMVIEGGTSTPFLQLKDNRTSGKTWAIYSGVTAAGTFDLYNVTDGGVRLSVDGSGNADFSGGLIANGLTKIVASPLVMGTGSYQNYVVDGTAQAHQYLDTRDYMVSKGHHAGAKYVVGGHSANIHLVVPYVNGTDVFVDGVIKIPNAQADGTVYQILAADLSAFSEITADKPISVMTTNPSAPTMNTNYSGRVLGLYVSRYQPIDIYVYSPYTKVTVEFYRKSTTPVDASSSSSGDFIYTTTIDAGSGFIFQEDVHGGGTSSGDQYFIVKADGLICAESFPDGGDYTLLSPAGMELIGSGLFTPAKFGYTESSVTSSITSVDNGNATYYRDNSGKNGIFAYGTADGAGGDAEFAVPIESLSDYYIYNEADITNFRLVSYKTNTIKVLDKQNNVLYTYDHRAATKSVPLYASEGADSGSGAALSTNGPFKFIGTAPFYLVCQNEADDEMVQLGAMQRELYTSKNIDFKSTVGSPVGDISPFDATANTLTFLTSVAHQHGIITGATLGVVDLSTGELEITQQGVITIKSDSIEADVIAANTITATEIASNTITATEIASNTITATEIAANTITATQIASGTITADKINVTDLALDFTANTVSGSAIGSWQNNQMRLKLVADIGTEPGLYHIYCRVFGSSGQVKTLSIVAGDGTYGAGSSFGLRSDFAYTDAASSTLITNDTGNAQFHSGQSQYWSAVDRFDGTNDMVQKDFMVRKISDTSKTLRLFILAQGNGSNRQLSNVQYGFYKFSEI